MRKKITALLTAILLVFLISGCAREKTQEASMQKSTQKMITATVGEHSEESYGKSDGEVTVQIRDKGFAPHSIEISKGTLVTWVNLDQKPEHNTTNIHRIIGRNFDLESKSVNEQETYSYIFETTGTFEYFDEKTGFEGTVIVH